MVISHAKSSDWGAQPQRQASSESGPYGHGGAGVQTAYLVRAWEVATPSWDLRAVSRSAAEGKYGGVVVLEPVRARFGRCGEGRPRPTDQSTAPGGVGQDRPLGVDGEKFGAEAQQDRTAAICADRRTPRS